MKCKSAFSAGCGEIPSGSCRGTQVERDASMRFERPDCFELCSGSHKKLRGGKRLYHQLLIVDINENKQNFTNHISYC